MVTKTDISIVVPVKNESGNVITLIQEIDDASNEMDRIPRGIRLRR